MFGWGKKKKDARPSRPSALTRWWEGMKPSTRKLVGRLYFMSLACVLVGGGIVCGMRFLEKRVTGGQMGPVPLAMKVVLYEPPGFMPANLLDQITSAITPADASPKDSDLAERVYQLAQANPWISKVHQAVRRPSDDPRMTIVEVKAEFRMPFAKVLPMKSQQAQYVDSAGVRLPSEQVARYFVEAPATEDLPARQVFFISKRDIPPGWKYYGIHYITIEGVAAPAPAVGQAWQGEDITEGLRLVSLVCTRTYANQITTIDVRNYNGRGHRGEAWLCMRAQIGSGPETIVRFGRFPNPKGDWEVSTDLKMYNLDSYVRDQRGHLAATAQYVDLQGEQLRLRPYGS